MRNMENLSIIMPAYNEERRIGLTLDRYIEYFDKLKSQKNLNYQILVVINASKDRTIDIVKKRVKKNRVSYLNLARGGKGYAVLEGFKWSLSRKFSIIGFVDADMATSPHAFYDLIRNLDRYDGVIASRYLPGAKVNPLPSLGRIVVSRVFNFLIRSLFILPYRDTQCGAKVFKREALIRSINSLSMSQWAFDVDLLYHMRKKNFRIKEIPTIWSDREYSKINFMKAGPWMGLAIIRLRLINSPLRDFIKIYDKIVKWQK